MSAWCLQCGKGCPDGFVTCSEACNLLYRSGVGRVEENGGFDVVDDTTNLLAVGDLCERLGLPVYKVYNAIKAGRLRRGEHFFKTAPRRTMYDPLKTANALDVAMVPVPLSVEEPGGLVGVAVEDSVPLADGTGDHVAKVQVRTAVPEKWSEASFHESQRPKRPTAAPDEIGSMLQVETVRTRGLAAAKEAFRDVLLAEADRARSLGEYRLQARLLEDYVFFEEGLKMVYDGRADV